MIRLPEQINRLQYPSAKLYKSMGVYSFQLPRLVWDAFKGGGLLWMRVKWKRLLGKKWKHLQLRLGQRNLQRGLVVAHSIQL